MYKKYLPFIIFIILVVICLFLWIKHERQSAKDSVMIEQQEQQIVIQNEIIKDKKIISQRQAVARAVGTNDNIVWLRQHRCKDCESR